MSAYLGLVRLNSKAKGKGPSQPAGAWIIVCSGDTSDDCQSKLAVIQSDADSGHHYAYTESVVVLADQNGQPIGELIFDEEIPILEPEPDDDTVICHRCEGTGRRGQKECRNCKGFGRLAWRNGNNT